MVQPPTRYLKVFSFAMLLLRKVSTVTVDVGMLPRLMVGSMKLFDF